MIDWDHQFAEVLFLTAEGAGFAVDLQGDAQEYVAAEEMLAALEKAKELIKSPPTA